MSDDKVWDLPTFRFRARLDDGGEATFMSASGLGMAPRPIEPELSYKTHSMIHLPGRHQPLNLTLERGLVAEDSSFHAWIKAVEPSALPERRTLLVALLDEDGQQRQSWTLRGAQPTKVRSSPAPEAGEIAIETLEIMCEGIELDPEG